MGPQVLFMLAATAASMAGDRQAQKERRGILNRSLAETGETQKQATKAVLDEGRNFSPDARMQAMNEVEAATAAQQQKDLAGAAPLETVGGAGNVSQDFVQAKANKVASEGDRLSSIARELAKVRAPGALLSAEGMRRANTMGNVNSMWSSARNMADARRLDAGEVEAPWWGQLSKIASMAGRSYTGGGS